MDESIWMEKRKQLLSELANRLVLASPDWTVCVAIDGVDGAGKTTFADELGDAVAAIGRRVIRASVDGFHNPKMVRYQRGRHSPEGFSEDSYNYSALKIPARPAKPLWFSPVSSSILRSCDR
jgi:uridine kinase